MKKTKKDDWWETHLIIDGVSKKDAKKIKKKLKKLLKKEIK